MLGNVIEIIEKLNLLPHPEGGYYREVYRSNEKISTRGLPPRYSTERTFSTSIYYLLQSDQFSSFHKIKSDEIWHFYSGSPIAIHLFFQDRKYEKVIMGNKIEDNQLLQYVIPKETWFAAEPIDKDSYSLVGCGVAPGFEFEDFELAERKDLSKIFPDYEKLISRLTNQ